MKPLLLLLAGALTGCAMNMSLLEDGKVHHGTFSPASRSIEANIDGDVYRGPVSQGVGFGFGNTFYGGKVGFGTTTVATGQWTGVLTNTGGKVIQCQFNAALGQGSGQCEGLDGRRFVLVIGQLTSAASAEVCPPGKRETGGACQVTPR